LECNWWIAANLAYRLSSARKVNAAHSRISGIFVHGAVQLGYHHRQSRSKTRRHEMLVKLIIRQAAEIATWVQVAPTGHSMHANQLRSSQEPVAWNVDRQ
jgi:hypothetical protein